MKNKIYILWLIFLLIGMVAFAQAPKTLSYQGKLSDAGGPLSGTFNLRFTIYDAATGGTSLWTETSTNVSIMSGNLAITLGKLTPINVQTDSPLWMGISVGANPEISPRVELTGSLYSLGVALPYAATSNQPTSLFSITATADGARAGEFTHQGTNSGQAALFATSTGGNLAFQGLNSGSNEGAASLLTTNAFNPMPTLRVFNSGIGSAVALNGTNSSNGAAVLNINNSGTGNAITANGKIQATQFIGDGSLLTNLPSNGLAFPYSATSSVGGDMFSLLNSAASGSAGVFINSSPSNLGSGAVFAVTNGLGSAGYFQVQNSANNNASLRVEHPGGGPSIRSRNSGTGVAGEFSIESANNAADAIFGYTNASGSAGNFMINNPNNLQQAIRASTNGKGAGVRLTLTNSQNAAAAIDIVHSGTGNAITANRPIQATQFIGNGIIITDGTQGVGKVLTSDANGLARWAAPSGVGWGLTGNGSTVDGTNFIGTIDNVPLNFRVNNIKAGRIDFPTGSTFLGINAGSAATGNFNSFFGANAGQNTTTGNGNTAIGLNSLLSNVTGNSNTSIGQSSLSDNTSGTRNVAIGYAALFHNTTANENTAVGFASLTANTTGTRNVGMGYNSLFANTTGSSNTAVGYNALNANLGGSDNVAVGFPALSANTIGGFNSAIGNGAIGSNTTGNNNVGLGYLALVNNTTGNNNTAVGYLANVNTGNLTNSTAIGAQATVDASNKVRIGNSAVTVIEGQVGFTAASDSRLKTNIKSLSSGLDFILKLRPVSYQMKQGDERTNWGFIAQDIERLIGTENAMLTIGGDTDRTLGLRYTDFVAPMVKAMQEQQMIIEELKTQNSLKDQKLKQMEASIDNLKDSVSELISLKAELEKIKSTLSSEAANGNNKAGAQDK